MVKILLLIKTILMIILKFLKRKNSRSVKMYNLRKVRKSATRLRNKKSIGRYTMIKAVNRLVHLYRKEFEFLLNRI